ncbi:MAG: hypothetical protein ACLQDV_08570 [Candidatus Binataceae bacterium]
MINSGGWRFRSRVHEVLGICPRTRPRVGESVAVVTHSVCSARCRHWHWLLDLTRGVRLLVWMALPGNRTAAEIWSATVEPEELANRAAYQKLLRDGDLDRCGITLLAGKAVGAPFVGAVAACLVIAEVLRLLHGGPLHSLIDLDLQSTEHLSLVPQARDFRGFNPGYVLARDLTTCG